MAVDYGEDFLQRIVAVHWPKRGGPTGGVFIAADWDSNVYFLRVGPGAEIDDHTGLPVWTNLGTLDFGQYSGSMFNGWVNGCSYADIQLNAKGPVFVLVGGGGSISARGTIMASQDGLTWTRVFQSGEDSETYRGANIFAVVWDETAKAFYAGGHQSDNFGDAPHEIFWQSETDILFRSSDGYNWSEVGRVVTRIDLPIGGTWPPWPAYSRGLLAEHCSTRVVDVNGNGLPDGFYKYDSVNNVMIAPSTLPKVDYLFGAIDYRPSGGGTVTVTDFRINQTSPPSNVGIPVYCVAETGAVAGGRPVDMGYWLAAGGIFNTLSNQCQASLLVPSTEAGGLGWKPLNPPGNSGIITIIGGQAKLPPP